MVEEKIESEDNLERSGLQNRLQGWPWIILQHAREDVFMKTLGVQNFEAERNLSS